MFKDLSQQVTKGLMTVFFAHKPDK